MIELNNSHCLLGERCKKAGDKDHCISTCYPYVRLYGESGKGGIVTASRIPKAYRDILIKDIPFGNSNPKAKRIITTYATHIIEQVENGTGLYLHGIPSANNPKGTGNGKTTASCIILNEYLAQRVIREIQKVERIDDIPAIFINASKYQNMFNAMFRGTIPMKEEASEAFYNLKKTLKKVKLLILDDIGVRDATDAYKSEFYELIDDRVNEGLATIYTSNVPTADLEKILDDRIASRIEGSTLPVPFGGEDMRRKGI